MSTSALSLSDRLPIKPGMSIRRLAPQILLRGLLNLHALVLLVLRPFRRRLPVADTGAAKSVLLTGTFYSENWIMNHLRPLVESNRCSRVWLVCTYPLPTIPKVQVVRPPRWLCRLVGETPARLVVFAWIGLTRRPDVVGGFHILVNGLAAPIVARLAGASSVYFCGGGSREVIQGGFLSGNRLFNLLQAPDLVLERKLLQAADACDLVITMGPRTADFFRDRGLKTRFEVVPGGIDGRACGGTGVQRKSFDLIFVGRLVEVKRIDILLQTVKILQAEFPTLACAIVGQGVLETELKRQAESLGISANVTFAGFQKNVVEWLLKSRIFVLTSDSEGLSLALMEAMMCGLPCVVSDVGELGDLVSDGLNGFLVRERSPAAFAQSIRTLLQSEESRMRFSRAARTSSARFDLARTAERWNEILPQI